MKPPPQHALLPHISRRIEMTLKKLHLAPEIAPAIFIRRTHRNKHRYSSVCTDPNGKWVVFYARLHNNQDAKQKFISDIQHLRAFSKSHSLLSSRTPKIFESSMSSAGEWYVREYLVARPVGNEYQATISIPEGAAPEFAAAFHALQHIPELGQPEKRDGDFFLRVAEGNIQATKPVFTSTERKWLLHFLYGSFDTIEEHSHFLVHGDAHAGNLLYEGRRAMVIDWETVQHNLRTTDIGYFYAGLRQQPKFRKRFLKDFHARISWKRQFELLFPKSVLFFALNHIYMIERNKPADLRPRERTLAVRFAKELALGATKGYNTLKRI